MINSQKQRAVAVAIFWALCGGILIAIYHSPPGQGLGIPCPVLLFTGLYCPGCGASRTLYSILHLDFMTAFRTNPLLTIFVPPTAVYLVCGTISFVKVGRNVLDDRIPKSLLWGIVVLLIVYFVLRNIPVYPFTLLQPPVV